MRVYKIKQISTGLYFTGVVWRHRNRRDSSNPGPSFGKRAVFWEIGQLNYNVERLITQGHSALFDDLEIESFEVVDPQPVKSKLKLKNVRNRIERNLIVSKLKSRI